MADIKISDAVPIGTLQPTDMLPVARVGSAAPYNATMQEVATFITQLASTDPPQMSAVAATPGVAEKYARADHVHPSDGTKAPLESPEFKGHPTAPTMLPSDSSDAIATTKFVHDLAQSGTLRTETPGIDDNSELVATTEYVQNQGSSQPPTMDGTPTAGVSQRFSRGDHTHPTDTSRAAASAIPAASSTAPTMDGDAATGVATTWARGDHVHPVDTSRYATSNPAGYQTQAQVRAGTTTNDNAAAGQIGEFVSASVQSGSGVPATSGVSLNITSISLTAGDWDVQGQVSTVIASGGHITAMSAWTSTASATPPTALQGSLHQVGGISTGGVEQIALPTGRMRLSIAVTTTVYLSATVAFTSTLVCLGYIGARRMR